MIVSVRLVINLTLLFVLVSFHVSTVASSKIGSSALKDEAESESNPLSLMMATEPSAAPEIAAAPAAPPTTTAATTKSGKKGKGGNGKNKGTKGNNGKNKGKNNKQT